MQKSDIIQRVESEGIDFIRLQFTDVRANPKSCTVPVGKLEEVLENGLWFDGSSVEGFVRVHESDMIAVPDISTFCVLPWEIRGKKIGRFICDIHTIEEKPYAGDPRNVLRKNLAAAKETDYDFQVGPETEFYLFGDMDGQIMPSPEPHDTASYFDLGPADKGEEVRKEILSALDEIGYEVETSHHEVGASQHEVDLRYSQALEMADKVMTLKYFVKTIAVRNGLVASFMPKPVFGGAGNGMHVHQSLWKGGANAFFDEGDDYSLSDDAYYFLGGQMEHARALSALTAPTINSYKRLVSGYEAPVYVCWAMTNRSALIRVPKFRKGAGSAARVELRCPDPSCNPYLAFSAMLAAGLHGIKKKISPPDPIEENVYDFDDSKLKEFYINKLPLSLEEAVEELLCDEIVKESLGKTALETFVATSKADIREYRTIVTDWEVKRYLRSS